MTECQPYSNIGIESSRIPVRITRPQQILTRIYLQFRFKGRTPKQNIKTYYTYMYTNP